MNTLNKLQEALDLMKQAEDLVNEANKENKSLSSYYGYSLQIIVQELNRFSDNSKGYLGRNTGLEEIINAEGENWNSDGSELDEDTRPVEYTPPPADNFPVMPENYTAEQLKDSTIHVIKEHDSKLKGIKFVKEVTGWGLKESKDFCDTLEY